MFAGQHATRKQKDAEKEIKLWRHCIQGLAFRSSCSCSLTKCRQCRKHMTRECVRIPRTSNRRTCLGAGTENVYMYTYTDTGRLGGEKLVQGLVVAKPKCRPKLAMTKEGKMDAMLDKSAFENIFSCVISISGVPIRIRVFYAQNFLCLSADAPFSFVFCGWPSQSRCRAEQESSNMFDAREAHHSRARILVAGSNTRCHKSWMQ